VFEWESCFIKAAGKHLLLEESMLSLRTLFHVMGAGLVGFGLVGLASNTAISAYAQTIQQEKEKKMSKSVTSQSPIACNMNALDKEQRRRHQSLTEQLHAAMQETRELPDGYSPLAV
jgi:hypothetical protein